MDRSSPIGIRDHSPGYGRAGDGPAGDIIEVSSGRRIVVTGASGMLGSYLLAELLDQGYRDITVMLRTLGSLDKIRQVWKAESIPYDPSIFDIAKMDIGDKRSIARAFEGAETVYNCAASVAIGGTDRRALIENNVSIARSVAEAAAEARPGLLVHVSSVAALVPSDTGRVDSDSKPGCGKAASAYAESKYLSELEIIKAGNRGVKTVTVNPATILGWGARGQGSSAIVPVLAHGLRFYPTGVTGWVDAKDVARAMVELSRCRDAAGRRFVLSSGNCSFKKFLGEGCRAAGKKPPRIYVPQHAARMASGAEKILCRLTGKRPLLTPEMVSILYGKHYYDGERIKKYVKFEYSPLGSTVERLVAIYRGSRD
ncbi:MAG: NAD-dependent epimerase/dehydratase family protein [Alistipes sp.]|nr:NAD-dependent epimerase/dehydratase family protein [Alistipes sp.]